MTRTLFLILFSLLLAVNARSDGFLQACDADISEFCSKVTPGFGRITACMYAHEDQISEGCDQAIDDMADLLDSLFAEARIALAICQTDIDSHCANTPFGDGRILSCLIEKETNISPACREIVADFDDWVVN